MITFYSAIGEPDFLLNLRQNLAKKGYYTNFYCLVTNRQYRNQSNFISRAILFFKVFLIFPFIVFYKISTSGKSAISVVTTSPFYLPFLASFAKKISGGNVIHLLWDLYPDALINAGMISSRASFAGKMLHKITSLTLARCDTTVFLGSRLQTYAEKLYCIAKHSVIIPVGGDSSPFQQSYPKPYDGTPIFLYSGNMGKMHDYKIFIDLIPRLIKSDSVYIFAGNGIGIQHLKKLHSHLNLNNVIVRGSLESDAWVDQLNSSHISFVSIKTGCENVVMPSKVFSSMLAGHAIIGICEQKSDLADLINQHDCGWIISPGDSTGLSKLIETLRENPSEVQRKRVRSYYSGHKYYSAEIISEKWIKLFDQFKT